MKFKSYIILIYFINFYSSFILIISIISNVFIFLTFKSSVASLIVLIISSFCSSIDLKAVPNSTPKFLNFDKLFTESFNISKSVFRLLRRNTNIISCKIFNFISIK